MSCGLFTLVYYTNLMSIVAMPLISSCKCIYIVLLFFLITLPYATHWFVSHHGCMHNDKDLCMYMVAMLPT